MKSRKLSVGKSCANYKTVSSRRSFKFLTEERINKLKKMKLKRHSEAKVRWAVNAYTEWRVARLENLGHDKNIFDANLNELSRVTKKNLEYSLCRFVPEVTKSKGEGPYPGKTLYQMTVAIQKFLEINKIKWKLIHGVEFEDLRIVLDNVMKECCAEGVGAVKKQADVISYEFEEEMWSKGILGEDTPDKLRSTVLFLIGINLALHAVDEHYYLRHNTPDKLSQISFENNQKGDECLVYREDSCTKTHDGGLDQMRKERKVVWVFPSSNINHCPMRLVKKYLWLCPKNYCKKPNFYLQSLKSPSPKQWYGREVVGSNRIKEVVKDLRSFAKIDGYFINHSLRRSGGSQLFQAGVDRKIVKEIIGHRSDAVDCYQITSEDQRARVGNILQGNMEGKSLINASKQHSVDDHSNVTNEQIQDQCVCKCKSHQNVSTGITQIVSEVISKNMKRGKTTIKLEIEISNE